MAISSRYCRSVRAIVKTARTSDLSLRGAKRRGNLAVHAGTQESPGEFAGAYLRLPRRACALLAMTREGGDCKLANAPLRMGKGPQACHCEAPQEPWQSREGTAVQYEPSKNGTHLRFVIARSEATWQSREGTPDPYRPPLKRCWPPDLSLRGGRRPTWQSREGTAVRNEPS